MSSQAPVFIISDDLTGAADCAWHFYSETSPVRISMSRQEPWDYSLSETVQVFDSETRSDNAFDAKSVVFTAVEGLSKHYKKNFYLFKKVDSTLRGNIAAEIDGIMTCSKFRLALLTPSFPANGRTLLQGDLYVNGIAVHQTAVGNDPRHGVDSSDVCELLRSTSSQKVHHVSLNTIRDGRLPNVLEALDEGIVVVDAVSDDDLIKIAECVVEFDDVLPCGSAGLAKALSISLKSRIHRHHQTVAKLQYKHSIFCKKVAVAVGSANPVSHRQLDYLLSNVVDSYGVQLHPLRLDNPEQRQQDVEKAMQEVSHIEDRVIAVQLHPDRGAQTVDDDYTAVLAQVIAKWVKTQQVISTDCSLTVICTGGDTAVAVCRALDINVLRPTGEIFPGVIWSETESLPSTPKINLVTKAGGFGDEDVLYQVVSFFSKGDTQQKMI
ncbi:MAG: four-carbon acid sugar kinase family protein [Bacilli bacterium]